MEYTMETDSNGKTSIHMVSLALVKRSGIEYEFTRMIDIDTDHKVILTESRAKPLAYLIADMP
jgi:hypothetical protein